MARATRQFSARLPADMLSALDERTQQTGESRSRLAERLIDEGLRMERHPGIAFRDGPAGRRPGITGGPDVWEAIAALRGRPERGEAAVAALADHLALSPAQVRAAVGYYAQWPEEIDAWIERNDREAEAAEAAWRREQAALA